MRMFHLQVKVALGSFPILAVLLLARAVHGVEWGAKDKPIIAYELAKASVTEILCVACQAPKVEDRGQETRY